MRTYHLGTLVDKIINNLAPIAGENSDDDDGDAIDFESVGQYHSGLVLCYAGAATGSPSAQSVVFTLEESDDDSTWTTVTDENGEDVTATLDANGETAELPFFPNERKRYIRVNRVVSLTGGSSPAWPTGAMVLLGHGRNIPS